MDELITFVQQSGGPVTQPVKVRRLSDQEGQKLQRIVRRGTMSTVRYRRAMILLASAGGNTVPVIARLVQADEDTVRDVIHRFNEIGLACLDPQWAGGRPRLMSPDDEEFIAATATTRPTKLGQPFTRWSIRKLVHYLRRLPGRAITLGREALRTLLHRRGITFQRTKTWKDSPDADFDAKLEEIEYALTRRPERTFAFDEFGPLGIRPTAGTGWSPAGEPDRLPATYRRTQGVRYFHGCYSVGDDLLWGVNRARKGNRLHLGRPEIDPGRPAGRRTDLRDPGQPVGAQELAHPHLGQETQGQAAVHADLRLLGQPDRGPLRAAAPVHPGQLRPPEPHRPNPGPARLSALAQRQRPPSRRSGRSTPRTRPDPQREGHPLGRPAPRTGSLTPLTQPGDHFRSQH
ncbi:Mobile element protein [[Actinomadura] parvosata subsp. kistnae]|nr:Mobile element protein [Actinomadura parvosata subsp. kistnae]